MKRCESGLEFFSAFEVVVVSGSSNLFEVSVSMILLDGEGSFYV